MAKYNILSWCLLALTIVAVAGHELFNNEAYICCDGTLHEFDPALGSCCGTLQYNSKDEACCDGNILPMPNKTSGTYNCYYSKDGAVAYDFENYYYCDGNLIPTPVDDSENFYKCCGTDLHDASTTFCCGGEVHPITSGSSCCGGVQLYNENDTLCCSITTLNEYDQLLERFELHSLEGVENKDNQDCCGLTKYDFTEQICCNEPNEIRDIPEGDKGSSYLECCGSDYVRDYRSQICLGEEVVDIEYQDDDDCASCAICGKYMIDYSKRGCCGDSKIYDLNSGIQCCDLAKQTYDNSTHVCCGNNVVELSEDDKGKKFNDCCSNYEVSQD